MMRIVQGLCVLLLASTVLAADVPLETAVKGNTLLARLMSSIKLSVDAEKTTGTWFFPTERAIRAFLKEMGLTEEEVLQRPQLIDAILSYHFVPGVALKEFTLKDASGGKELISSNDKEPSILKTGDVDNDLEIFRTATTGAATLIDAQGNRVAVTGKSTQYGKMVIWDISNVLLSAIRYYPEWTSFQELYQRASQTSKPLADAIAGRTAFTYLLPSNDALAPAMQALTKAGSTDLSQLLEYHVLPVLRPVPTGWKDGEKVNTLLVGHSIKTQLGQSPYTDPYDDTTKQGPELTLVPEVGKPGKVVVSNVYAGKSVLQGVDAPLLPNTAIAKVLGAAAGAAKTAAEKAPKPADNKSGRKLLQRNHSAGRNNNWAAQNTQSAIRAAAAGRVPASYATARGSQTARNAGRGCINCVNWVGTRV